MILIQRYIYWILIFQLRIHNFFFSSLFMMPVGKIFFFFREIYNKKKFSSLETVSCLSWFISSLIKSWFSLFHTFYRRSNCSYFNYSPLTILHINVVVQLIRSINKTMKLKQEWNISDKKRQINSNANHFDVKLYVAFNGAAIDFSMMSIHIPFKSRRMRMVRDGVSRIYFNFLWYLIANEMCLCWYIHIVVYALRIFLA